ncbi:MAG: hypothetical protein D6769_03130, partial [Methanobacteriota archaeon]
SYGCPKETIKLIDKWEEIIEKERVRHFNKVLPPFSSTKHLKQFFKEEVILPGHVYSSRLIYNAIKAKEALESKNVPSFIAYISELPTTNNIKGAAISAILSEEVENNKELVRDALMELEKIGQDYSIHLKEESSFSMPNYNVETSSASALVTKEKKSLSIDIKRGQSKPILTTTEGDMKSILIIGDALTKVYVWTVAREEIGEGNYVFKGPISIEVTSPYAHIVYKVEEPQQVSITFKIKKLEEL